MLGAGDLERGFPVGFSRRAFSAGVLFFIFTWISEWTDLFQGLSLFLGASRPFAIIRLGYVGKRSVRNHPISVTGRGRDGPARLKNTYLSLHSLIAIFGSLACGNLQAVTTNSWTSAVSGSWQDLNWSLGEAPGSGQVIMLTNAGWKAVAINPSTAQAFPQMLSVYSITVASPTNSYNELLLNYFGFDSPLTLVGGLYIGSNSSVVALQSALQLPPTTGFNGLEVGGTFIQAESAQVSADTMTVGDLGEGVYYLTNGTLTVIRTQSVGGTFTGTFNQFGGSNSPSNLRVQTGSQYHLYDGNFRGAILVSSGDFHQVGGTVDASGVNLVRGSYILDGGVLNTQGLALPGEEPPFSINGQGYFLQNGGTNNCTSGLGIGTGAPLIGASPGSYVLSNGVLVIPDLEIGLSGSFDQFGGSCTVKGGISVTGSERGENYWLWGAGSQSGGNLSANSFSVSIGNFMQSGGTNDVAGELAIGPTPVNSVYTLSGGLLMTSNSTVAQDNLFSRPISGGFLQGGGVHRVANLLRVSGTSKGFIGYVFGDGELSAQNLQVENGATFDHRGGSLRVPGLFTLANGTWLCSTGQQQFGQFRLGFSQSGSSRLSLPGGAIVLRFADSSGVIWSNSAILTIENWSGSLVGGGNHQVFFGANSAGLTAQQLSQIQFSIGSNLYSAKILATGEVLPDQGSSTSGPVNSWASSTSGNWDQAPNWSLGVLPDSSQSVLITNSGWKAVAINPSTPGNFPGSMTVSNLTIRGAWDTENVLLLNYLDTAVPLTVLNGLTLQDDGQILNFNSGLVVQGGTVVVTNSQIIQDGGFVRTTNAQMNLSGSKYQMTNGVFQGGVVLIGGPGSSQFNQYGGAAIIATLDIGTPAMGGGGAYSLYGGYLNLPGGLSLKGDNNSMASYFQSGGSNQTTQVMIEPGLFGISPSFKLNGGLLADNNVSVVADDFGSAAIEQNGGSHVITNTLTIAGGAANGYTVLPATYSLNGGTLFAGVIEVGADGGDSVFVQSNATTSAGTVYAHSLGYYSSHNTSITLAGGTLSCSNFTTVDGGGRFNQSGGALVVSNLLDLGGSRDIGGYMNPIFIYGRYTFIGGTVTASNISITGDWIIGDGRTNRISNPGFFSLSHTLQISNAVEQLGRFVLASNATIDLAGSASELSFASSSGEAWAGAATLVIANWNGNPSGGGAEQLKFGTDPSGLTPTQLSQIQFRIGSSTNFYSAKILTTGEVIPDTVSVPGVALARHGNNLILTWPVGWSLQTATNAPGPYFDIPGATPPYTNDMPLQQQQFFRLRQGTQ